MIENVASEAVGMSSNAFLVWGPPGSDPGVGDEAEPPVGRRVLVDCGANYDAVAAIERYVDGVDAVVLTHTHPDHVGEVDTVREGFGVSTYGHDPDHPAVDDPLDETVRMGTGSYEVIHTPGHRDDHVCLYEPDAGVLFAGDLVFAGGGFGRTDLAQGDRATLIDSIERLLARTDRIAELHAGHGPSATGGARTDVETALRAARTR